MEEETKKEKKIIVITPDGTMRKTDKKGLKEMMNQDELPEGTKILHMRKIQEVVTEEQKKIR